MRAVVYHAFGAAPAIETVPDPKPPPGGVVLRVLATGLCRSDWHGWMGHDADVTLPHVPGHELVGVVESIGAGVQRFGEGARVTLPFACGCGACVECTSGNQQVCDRYFQPGFTHWGSFAERVAIHHADGNLVRMPSSIDDVAAASLGCRFITAFRAVVDQGRVRPGEWLVVFGSGGVGTSALMIGHALGARVVAVDVRDDRLTFARELGAEAAVDAKSDDVVAALHDVTGGGAHVSIDALGSVSTCTQSIASLRKRGRHVQVGLMTGDAASASLPMDRVVALELEILGSHGMQAHRYPALLDMVAHGALDPGRLVGGTIALDDAPAALATLPEGDTTGMTVIRP